MKPGISAFEKVIGTAGDTQFALGGRERLFKTASDAIKAKELADKDTGRDEHFVARVIN